MTLNEAGVRQSWVDYDWEQLLEHRSSNVSKLSPAPPWLLYKVQQLRPACRAEWELIVFARLCVEEAMACRANRAKGRAGARPLTVGEIESNWSESCGLRDLLLSRWVPNITDLQEAMADSRRQSSCSLLEETKFFGEVLELVHLAVASGAVRKVSTVSPAVISFPLCKVCRCPGSASNIFPVHQTIKEVGLGKMDGSYIPTWAPLRRR